MKRMLFVTSVASMIIQFNMENIRILQAQGWKVDVACNLLEGNTCTIEEVKKRKNQLEKMGVDVYQVSFSRDISELRKNWSAFCKLRKLLKYHRYDMIHCQSPVGGVLARLAAIDKSTKVIYTAHGLHFFSGSPAKNWILFFPIEWILAWKTDVLITINHEDYKFAKLHLHAKKVEYVPGIGVEVECFSKDMDGLNVRESMRASLRLTDDDIMLFSAGQLSIRKNQMVLLEMMSNITCANLKLYIAGLGELEHQYKQYIRENQMEDRVNLLGYRQDIEHLMAASDVFIFPSLQEGLPVALMEAMAAGLPCIVSKIRGNTDLIIDGKGGYVVENESEQYEMALNQLLSSRETLHQMGLFNKERIKKHFSSCIVNERMKKIYDEC